MKNGLYRDKITIKITSGIIDTTNPISTPAFVKIKASIVLKISAINSEINVFLFLNSCYY